MMHLVVAQLLSRIWLWNCMDCSMLGFPFTISWVCSNLFFADYRASPSSAAKNIINLISVLTIWWRPCVELFLILLEKDIYYDQCVLLAKPWWPLPCFVLYSKAKFACYSGISWFPTFAFDSPMIKRHLFLDVSSRRSCKSSQNLSTSASSALLVGVHTWITVILNDLLWKRTKIIYCSWYWIQVLNFRLFCWPWSLLHFF